ncbi:hypothetical protein F511_44352 [Dorcoceras hygrometricum]|uniref:Uncharacterized protein n=1 Tax=Dorcoceras hygrometricum TaxID=472368 RepID=A0A2Z7AHI0_9LAMI|nr:hypothetical protein F511_44352 [Dorcoceras hygrometricum]
MLTQKLKRAGCRICSTGNAHAEAFGIIQLVVPGFLTSVNRKIKSQGFQRHQYRQKQRLEATEIGDRKLR